MRLLHVVPTYLPATRYGGPIRSVHGLCAALAACGHDVHVFTTNVDGPGDSAVPLGRPVAMDGVTVWYFPSDRLRRLFWSPPMAQALRRDIPGFDLVHLHSVFLWPTWAAARAARRNGLPYVLSPRGMLVRDLVRRKSRWLKTTWIEMIERRTIEQASGIHLTSCLEADELNAFGFRLPPVRVIANGIDVPIDAERAEELSPDIRQALDGGAYVLYLGRLSWKKGLDKLICAAAAEPRLRLVIAGNDDERHLPQVHEWIAQAGIAQRATVLARFVTGADKAALLAGAAVFALPSVSENFGIAALEAMAAGCPVLTTEGVGLAAAIRDAGAGIVTESGEFGAAMGRLLDDPALRTAMSENARRVAVQRFGWAGIAEQMESFYNAVLPDSTITRVAVVQ
jgi:glycosyltransferase involved in cell wall biosynthesis